MDWRFAKVLTEVTETYSAMTAATRAGKVLRTHYGFRRVWKGGPENLPTPEEIAAAKADLDWRTKGFVSTCACCKETTTLASEYSNIKEFGVCTKCQMYVEGEQDGVMYDRLPTLDEALTTDANVAGMGEFITLRDAILKMQEK